MGEVKERLYNGARAVVPFRDISHIEKLPGGGILIITKNTAWDYVGGRWANPLRLYAEANEFLKAFSHYRMELEAEAGNGTELKGTSSDQESPPGWDDFIKQIMQYESDTFSAEGSGITRQEAERVTRLLMTNFFDRKLDGILISEALDSIRER